MAIEWDADQYYKRDNENNECLLFCELEKASDQQYDLSDEQNFQKTIENCKSSHDIDLEEKTDQEEVNEHKSVFRDEAEDVFKCLHSSFLQTCAGITS